MSQVTSQNHASQTLPRLASNLKDGAVKHRKDAAVKDHIWLAGTSRAPPCLSCTGQDWQLSSPSFIRWEFQPFLSVRVVVRVNHQEARFVC